MKAETEPGKPIEDISSEELALVMQREYESILRSQGNLIVVEKELQRRLEKKRVETKTANGEGLDSGSVL